MTVRSALTILLYLALAVSSYFLFSPWVGVWISGMMLLFSVMVGDLMTTCGAASRDWSAQVPNVIRNRSWRTWLLHPISSWWTWWWIEGFGGWGSHDRGEGLGVGSWISEEKENNEPST